jgi:glycine/D-amino acid oxidase-like deaminating enzyme
MELSDQQSFAPYLQDSIEPTPSGIIAEHGSGLTKGTGRLKVNAMMAAVRDKLGETGCFTEEYFNWEAVEPHSEGVQYKDIKAHAIISCEGTHLALGKSQLKQQGFSPVKGELLTVQLHRDLGKECIHQGHFMLGEEDQKASIGATYAWEGFEDGPTPKAKEELIQHIDKVWAEEYTVIDHYAGTRPATKDRRPIIGPHPGKENVWVFNGMGSRAVLMVPYLAQNMAEHLLYGVPLIKECDPARFKS